jgi:hypothetical protein
MIIGGSIPDIPGRRRKRKRPIVGIPDATKPRKRKPTIGIPDAPKKAIPTGATPVKTPVTGKIDPRPNKPIPVGAKPAGTNAIPDATRKPIPSGATPVSKPIVGMPDKPRRRKPVNPNDPNLQKMKPTGGVNAAMGSSTEALKPNEGTSTMQAAANLAGQFKKRLNKKI